MCGICGEFRWGQEALVDRELIRRMTSTLIHRGPDDEGFHVKGPVGLGMRRLSIIDVAGGHQPIFNEDKTTAVVYNGEIYNYRELKAELEALGHRFQTHSDTEVLVHAYEVWGDSFPNRLNGMFAFAVWDEKNARLLIGRDRMGIKPLYYRVTPDKISFASEIKALRADPSFSREIDPQALDEYLSLRYIPCPRSIYQGVRKLEPGHTLSVQGGKTQLKRYWHFPLPAAADRKTLPRCLEELDALLADAVKRQLMSEVPLGLFLSGGLDSPTIAYYATQAHGKWLTSFNIHFRHESYSEREGAAAVAKKLNLNHQEMEVDEDIQAILPQLVDIFDEPFSDDSAIPTYFLTQLARQHMTVALSGDGGDELFGGYPTYIADAASAWYRRLPRFVQSAFRSSARFLPVSHERISFDFKVRAFLNAAGRPQPAAHFGWQEILTAEDKAEFYAPEFRHRAGGHPAWESFERAYREAGARNPLERMLYVDQKTVLADGYLVKMDRLSMAHSLEVRPPFLDHRLVEFAVLIPPELKIKGFTTKYLIRRLMKDRLPAEIIQGAKKGFSPPMPFWLAEGPLGAYAKEVFASGVFESTGMLRGAYALKLLDDHRARRRNNARKIWTLLMLALWLEKYG
jgi:asparagine synthase (glutamine-hydrolysing)